MAQWLHDPAESRSAGVVRFRLPYPKNNWREERRWNEELVQAMNVVWRADSLFSSDPQTWDHHGNEFYKWMLREIKGLGISYGD